MLDIYIPNVCDAKFYKADEKLEYSKGMTKENNPENKSERQSTTLSA